MNFLMIFLCAYIGPVCQVLSANKVSYCYVEDENPYRRFGGRTPYDVVRAEKIEVLGDDCKPIYIWGAFRHPTRNGGEESWDEEKMYKLKNKINEYATNSEYLCPEDKLALQNWKYTAGKDLSLVPQGLKDVRSIVNRLKGAFGQLSEKAFVKENFDLATSSSSRCRDAAVELINTWLGTAYENCETAGIDINDELLKVRHNIDLKNSKQKIEFENSEYIDDVVNAISIRLGFPEDSPLTKEEVMQLYNHCSNENSWYPGTHPGLCAAFEPEHLKVYEYLNDIMTYYYCGYGANNDETFADKLFEDFITKLVHASKNKSEDDQSKLGTFYTFHNIGLLPFLKRFHWQEEDEPLTMYNYVMKKDTREFRTSEFLGYSANFVGVLYDCIGEYYVAPYINEHLVKLKMCANKVCTLEELENYFEFITKGS